MKTFAAALVLSTLAVAASAQPGGRGGGSVPLGSKGYGWQTEQALAKEEAARFQLEIAELSDEEWKERALAWLRFETSDTGMTLDDVFRVAGVDADARATTEPAEYFREDDPSWIVTYRKKTPKKLTLTLTDDAATTVQCAMPEGEVPTGYFGIFLHETHLVCFAR